MTQTDDVKKFFIEVYDLSSNYATHPAGLNVFDRFLAENFSATSAIKGQKTPLQIFRTRESWKAFLKIIHSFFHETITPLEYSFDLEQNKAEVKLKIQCTHLKTGALISEFSATGSYTLARENGILKISRLELVADDRQAMIKPYIGPVRLPRFMFNMMRHKSKYGS